MPCRWCFGSLAAAGALLMSLTGAWAHDESKYPDWAGQWRRPPGVNNQWDPTKPRGQEGAPLTAEYQAIFEANLKDQAEGGQFPEDTDTSFMGYSIGKWVDTDGDGRYDELLVETRFLKSPRAYDSSGIPLHPDGKTIVQERFYQDKDKPDVLHDEVTTIDNALTRPWMVTKHYNRVRNPIWVEAICSENNDHIKLGNETYMRSAEGLLMPAKKGQRPPDLRYFNMQDAKK